MKLIGHMSDGLVLCISKVVALVCMVRFIIIIHLIVLSMFHLTLTTFKSHTYHSRPFLNSSDEDLQVAH